jgi:rRNA maturation RNase YbeY
MNSSKIEFFSESVDFELSEPHIISKWLETIIKKEGGRLNHLNYIFCSDDYLLDINKDYLNHDTFTDIITFPLEDYPLIEGDIFISVDRIKENSLEYSTSFQNELLRVMAHGVLHLCGYQDKTEEETILMRKKEEDSILLFSEI